VNRSKSKRGGALGGQQVGLDDVGEVDRR